ncbi:MAG TPA: hypothetical protein VFS67_28940 [Polyangiaceae bacterium]|jgi:hypothetical protein|nr:hypothetical protein [Polyangiaceae bacterium]
MAIDDKSTVLHQAGKHPWWRSSLYEEPVWVSVAWILGPLAVALLAVYFAVR